jgi:hypothetical protein
MLYPEVPSTTQLHTTKRNKGGQVRSVIWKMPKQEFTELVKNSKTISEILEKGFGKTTSKSSGTHSTIKRRIVAENIDISHIPLGRSHKKGIRNIKATLPLEKCLKTVFIEKCTAYKNQAVIRYIKLYNLLSEYKCAWCNNSGCWNNQQLILNLDHINGIRNDNRLFNLRWLCPNCHTQTPTYAGRKTKDSI